MATNIDVAEVQEYLRKFAEERDWEPFHSPKNLAMALAGEVGELVEPFQWLTPEQSKQVMQDPNKASQIEDELADVLQYVIRLADVLSVDLNEVLWTKLRKNESKYPVALAKGNARKYTEFPGA